MATNLSKRVKKAKAAAIFAKVEETLPDGRAKVIGLPGSNGAYYRVILRRKGSQVSTECLKQTGIGEVGCKGNSNGHVCYHSIAAMIVASEGKARLLFCQRLEQAKRLTRLGGNLVNIISWKRQASLWAVAREVK